MKEHTNIDDQNSSENNNEELDSDLQNASGGFLPIAVIGGVATTMSTKMREGAGLDNTLAKLEKNRSLRRVNSNLEKVYEIEHKNKQVPPEE